jgi:hypothetical protein
LLDLEGRGDLVHDPWEEDHEDFVGVFEVVPPKSLEDNFLEVLIVSLEKHQLLIVIKGFKGSSFSLRNTVSLNVSLLI